MVVLAWGAVASVAQAQDKKFYVIGSLGIYAVSGDESVTMELSFTNSEYRLKNEYSEDGQNLRLGFGAYINETLSLEFGYVDFGDINNESTSEIVRCDSFCAVETTFSKLLLDVYDISAVYYKPLNEKVNLTFRGGITSYQWVDKDGKDIKEGVDDVKTASGTTPLLGIGAEFGDIHVELRRYDLTLTVGEYDYYTTPMVLSVGYKARF